MTTRMYQAPVDHYTLTSTHHDGQSHWAGFNGDKYKAAREAVLAFVRLLGVGCQLNDVAPAVLDVTQSLEDLKNYLIQGHSNSRFYLMLPHTRNHRDGYRIFYYATHRGARVCGRRSSIWGDVNSDF
ncbi:hypothetical protein AG1IA_03901 [Rhizoctonia solani AG-1 IA]|uniref:Uncharacterized protein n=1 Tax=Thanatephorus cucumeris (strain AG1-IA) TaxID=983506 RepID=L8WZ72_THACA|nr:hypothetical protein AG1IA_03901 [Rhizoctonia solani AG-1 IA]